MLKLLRKVFLLADSTTSSKRRVKLRSVVFEYIFFVVICACTCDENNWKIVVSDSVVRCNHHSVSLFFSWTRIYTKMYIFRSITLLLIVHQSFTLLPILKECNYKYKEEGIKLYKYVLILINQILNEWMICSRIWNMTARGKAMFFSACSESITECNSLAAACLLDKGQLKYLAKRFYLKKGKI